MWQYFDTGKSEIKAESEPSLKEIAKMLKQNAKLKVFVVGHTDNVGGLESNMKLYTSSTRNVGRVSDTSLVASI